ncbi:T9SS type A sorting domain-containing protein [bacterium]|nr:T9SS type A sorting domain-containing protein [bacterium]
MKQFLATVLIMFSFFLVRSAHADIPLVDSTLDYSGKLTSVGLLGNYALLGSVDHGLTVLDISDPSSPFPLELITEYGDPMDIVINDTVAFILFKQSGIGVFDITDPTNITARIDPFSTHLGPGISDKLHWQDPYLFVFSHRDVNGIGDPYSETGVALFRWEQNELTYLFESYGGGGILEPPWTNGAMIWPDVYVQTGFTFHHYRWEAENGFLHIGETWRDGKGPVFAVDSLLYSIEYSGLVIYDPADDGELVPLDTLGEFYPSDGLLYNNHFLLLNHDELSMYDVSDPLEPDLLSTVTIEEGTIFGDRQGSRLSLLVPNRTMKLYNLTETSAWNLIGEYAPPIVSLRQTYLANDMLYVSHKPEPFVHDTDTLYDRINISDPLNPVIQPSPLITESLVRVRLEQGKLFGFTDYSNGSLVCYDLNDPDTPVYQFRYELEGDSTYYNPQMIDDHTLAVGVLKVNGDRVKRFLDLGGDEPSEISEWEITDVLDLTRNLALVKMGGDSIGIYDIQRLDAPRYLASIHIPEYLLFSAEIEGDIISLISGDEEEFYLSWQLTSYTLENWSTPVLNYTTLIDDDLFSWTGDRTLYTTRYGQYLFYYDSFNGLFLYDLLGEPEPIRLLSYSMYTFSEPVAAWPYLILANDRRVEVYDASEVLTVGVDEELAADALPTTISLLPAYPNPFNAGTVVRYTLPTAGLANVQVFDLLGRQVRLLEQGYTNAGERQVYWDGRSDNGSPVASGMYLLRLDADNQQAVRKVVLVK